MTKIEKLNKQIAGANALILILSIVALLSYFILPLYQIRLSYTYTEDGWKDSLEPIIEVQLETIGYNEMSTEQKADIDAQIDKFSAQCAEVWKNLLKDSGSTSLHTLNTMDILSATIVPLFAETDEEKQKAFCLEIFKSAKNSILTGINGLPFIPDLPLLLKQSLPTTISAYYGSYYIGLPKEARAKLDQAGINEEYLTSSIDKLIDAMFFEKTTPTEFVDLYFATGSDIYQKAYASQFSEDNFIINNLPDYFQSEEETAKAKSEMLADLQNKTDENGYLDSDKIFFPNIEDRINRFIILGDFLDYSPFYQFGPSSLDLSSFNYIYKLFTIGSCVIIFTVLTWLFFIIKILCKSGKENNAVRMGAPILFSSLPFWYIVDVFELYEIFDRGLYFEFNSSIFGELLAIVAPEFNILSFILPYYYFLDVYAFIVSGSLVAFAIGIFLTLFCWFYYGRKRKELKRLLRKRKNRYS